VSRIPLLHVRGESARPPSNQKSEEPRETPFMTFYKKKRRRGAPVSVCASARGLGKNQQHNRLVGGGKEKKKRIREKRSPGSAARKEKKWDGERPCVLEHLVTKGKKKKGKLVAAHNESSLGEPHVPIKKKEGETLWEGGFPSSVSGRRGSTCPFPPSSFGKNHLPPAEEGKRGEVLRGVKNTRWRKKTRSSLVLERKKKERAPGARCCKGEGRESAIHEERLQERQRNGRYASVCREGGGGRKSTSGRREQRMVNALFRGKGKKERKRGSGALKFFLSKKGGGPGLRP